MLVTASTAKVVRVKALGADAVIDYKNEDFADAVLRLTDRPRRGRDPRSHRRRIPRAEPEGARDSAAGSRVIGVMGGRRGELDIGRLLTQRQSILGSVLRPRTTEQKTAIIHAFARDVLPLFAQRRDRAADSTPCIRSSEPRTRTAQWKSGSHFGKLVLRVADEKAR